jgi:hypothetical protein
VRIEDRFENGLNALWDVTQVGCGTVTAAPGELRMVVGATPPGRYSNAQIADYHAPGFHFGWRPPVRMTVTAWASAPADELRGTAGFGFWNHPFSPDVKRFPQLPQAIWFFFSSPPNDMRLAHGVGGPGWKAATINAANRRFLALTPLLGPAALLMRSPSVYDRLWPPIQRTLQVSEKMLDGNMLAERHTYALDWRMDGATFAVDGATVLDSPYAPRGPLGFVAWLDNQYAVATPQGRLRFGLVPVEREQSLSMESVVIEQS